MPTFKTSASGASPVGFKVPSTTPARTHHRDDASLDLLSAARPLKDIAYPTATGATAQGLIEERLSRRSGIEYFVPEPKVNRGAPNHSETCHDITQAPASRAPNAATAQETAPGDTTPPEDEEQLVVRKRLPVSAIGKVYFQIETDGATEHESVGIVVIDTVQNAAQMFDRVGRQHGNRPEPGYPLTAAEAATADVGSTLKVDCKSIRLVTALAEEAFRSGEFFLRTEHDHAKREEKRKIKEAAVAREKLLRPKLSFGGSMGAFNAMTFRKRPREGETGFFGPLQGRTRPGSCGVMQELKAAYDHDAEGAVVLFRADNKRDAMGQVQVSVVVDPIIGDKLLSNQRIGVQFLYDCVTGERMPGYNGCILADATGLGKTIQTVATIWTCLKQGKRGVPIARKCLVVAPKSSVRNWCNEFDKWLGVGKVVCFAISESTPKGDRILSRFDGEGDVLVISYDQLRKYVERLSTMKGIDLVVCDEGRCLANAEICKAVDMLPTKRRIILSGTPIQNDLSEFHAMVNFVNPGILGNKDLFASVFAEPVMMAGRAPSSEKHLRSLGGDRAHYLANMTQKFILRRTQTIND